MSNGPVQVGDSWYLWGLTGAVDGAGLALEDTGLVVGAQTLYRIIPGAGSTVGHWEPVTNGDPDNPELVFYEGDIVVYWVTD